MLTPDEEARIRHAIKQDLANQNQAAAGAQEMVAPSLSESPAPERITLGNVDTVFAYQPWGPGQMQAGDQVREALAAAAKAVLRNVPDCPQRTRVLNHLVDARMIANAAITFNGRF